MTASSETVDALQERANDLYWNSPDPVDDVAGQLGMRRSALYAAVRPLPAGAECPDCGGELVFPNRSSRTAGRAMCLACDRTVALDEAPTESTSRGPRLEDGSQGYAGRDTGYGEGGGRLRHWREGLAAVEPERAARLGGAAALGVVVGAAAASLFRRRGSAPD